MIHHEQYLLDWETIVKSYAWEPLTVVVSFGLLVVPFGFLALVTCLTGWTIQREKEEQNT